jgi:hypothetical protein
MPPAAKRRDEEERLMIEAHIAAKGVTRAVDWGEHAELVATIRGFGIDLVRAARMPGKRQRHGAIWLANDKATTTKELYERAAREAKARGLTPIKPPPKERR